MRAEIVCRRAEGGLVHCALPQLAECVVGAGPGADLELPLAGIEARHIRLVREPGGLVACDLGGGLRVNGKPATRAAVGHLDVLALGAVRVVLLVGEAETPERRRGLCAVWLHPQPAGERIPLAPGASLCGRAAAAHVVLADVTASKRHARLWRGFDALSVEDLGSANGTRVNGALVSRARLADGDEVAFGALAFRVELEEGLREVSLPQRAAAAAALGDELLSAETTAFVPFAPDPGAGEE